jgi:hypothetical protein
MQPDIEAEVLATNLRVVSSLHRALDLLGGLPVVVFKGPLLTARVYGRLSARASADCDLWVPESRAEEALERLLAAGFRPSPHLDAARALERRGQVALWPRGDLEQVSIDLHARPFSRPYFEVDESVLEAHLEVDVTFGRTITTFDLRLAFCHAVAHYVQHHLADSYLDVVGRLWALLAPGPPASAPLHLAAPGDLMALIAQTCGVPATEVALHRHARLHGKGPPEAAQEWRARVVGRVLDAFDGAPPGLVRKFLSLYLVRPERLPSGVWEAAFPPEDVLREQYGLGPRVGLQLRHLLRAVTER